MLPTQPTLQELKDRMLADLDYRLPSLRSRPAKSVLLVLVTVLAGVVSSLYAFGGWIARQLDPLTASESWLVRWAARLGVPRKQATASLGAIQFSGTGDVPAGTRLRHVSTGVIYQTLQTGAVDAAIETTAETTGVVGNIPLNSSLTLETPIAGISMTATVVTAFTGGYDQESLADWASRVAAKLQERQKIGDADDYRRWAIDSHPAIVDARVYQNTPALGDISISVLGTPENPVIDSLALAEAQQTLDRLRNVCGTVRLYAVMTTPAAIRIADVPDDVHAVIADGITNLFATRAKFDAQIWPEEIERIIALHSSTYTLLSPVAKLQATDSNILTFGGITWL